MEKKTGSTFASSSTDQDNVYLLTHSHSSQLNHLPPDIPESYTTELVIYQANDRLNNTKYLTAS